MENSNKNGTKKGIVTIIAVAIIAGAIGFVISHFLVSRPSDLRAEAFPGGDAGDICARIAEGDMPSGRGSGETGQDDGRMSQMEEYCADGKIDDTERAAIEASRPAGRPSFNQ